jgi:hypothetical protein
MFPPYTEITKIGPERPVCHRPENTSPDVLLSGNGGIFSFRLPGSSRDKETTRRSTFRISVTFLISPGNPPGGPGGEISLHRRDIGLEPRNPKFESRVPWKPDASRLAGLPVFQANTLHYRYKRKAAAPLGGDCGL